MKKILIALIICFVALLLIGPLVFRDSETTVDERNTDEPSENREAPDTKKPSEVPETPEMPKPDEPADTGKNSPEPEKAATPPETPSENRSTENKNTEAVLPIDIITDQPVVETPPESPIVATEIPEKAPEAVAEKVPEDKPVPEAKKTENPVSDRKVAETGDSGLFPFDPAPVSAPEPAPAPEPVATPASRPETADKPAPEPSPEPVVEPAPEPESEKKADCLLLKDVSFKARKDLFEMDVIANCAIREYKHFYVGNPPKLVIDLRGTWKRQTRPEHVIEDSDLVSRIRIGLHPEFVRLVIDLKGNEKITPLLRETPQGMSVSIRRK